MTTRMMRVLITWSVKSNKRFQFFREFQIMIFPNSHLVRLDSTSPTLLDIVSKLVSGGVVNKQPVSLTQSIQQHVNKQWNQTTLGVAVILHHKFGSSFGSKFWINYSLWCMILGSQHPTRKCYDSDHQLQNTLERNIWNVKVYSLTEGWLVPGLMTII